MCHKNCIHVVVLGTFFTVQSICSNLAIAQATVGSLSRGLTIIVQPKPRTLPRPLPQGDAAPKPRQLRLVPYTVQDPMVQSPAFQMLIPHDWRVEGGVVWRPNSAALAVVDITIRDPSGRQVVRSYPTDFFCFSESLLGTFSMGTRYLGMELQQPVNNIADYIRTVILPRYRNGQSMRIVAVQELPEIAAQVAATMKEAGMQKQVVAARVRMEYVRTDGTSMEADFFCTLWYCASTVSHGFVQWGCERCYSFAAPRGQLDRSAKTFQTIVASVRMEPRWLYKYEQVRRLFLQRLAAGIRDAGRLSRYLTRINGEINDVIITGYQERQRTLDSINRRFSNTIRGVQDFQLPDSTYRTALPSGYDSVWISDSGEYLLSDTPGLDPNHQSTMRWRRLRPVSAARP